MSMTHQNESYVADAHALVWHIADDKRLGKEARAILTLHSRLSTYASTAGGLTPRRRS